MDHVPQMAIQQQTIEDNNGQENALGDQQDKTSKQYSYHKSNNVTVTHKFPVIDHINFLLPIAALLFFSLLYFFFLYVCGLLSLSCVTMITLQTYAESS